MRLGADCRAVIELYYDCAYFWRDIAYVMNLPVPRMLAHLRQAQRIAQRERDGRRD